MFTAVYISTPGVNLCIQSVDVPSRRGFRPATACYSRFTRLWGAAKHECRETRRWWRCTSYKDDDRAWESESRSHCVSTGLFRFLLNAASCSRNATFSNAGKACTTWLVTTPARVARTQHFQDFTGFTLRRQPLKIWRAGVLSVGGFWPPEPGIALAPLRYRRVCQYRQRSALCGGMEEKAALNASGSY